MQKTSIRPFRLKQRGKCQDESCRQVAASTLSNDIKKQMAAKAFFGMINGLQPGDKSIIDIIIINYDEDDVHATKQLYTYIFKLIQANAHGNRLDS